MRALTGILALFLSGSAYASEVQSYGIKGRWKVIGIENDARGPLCVAAASFQRSKSFFGDDTPPMLVFIGLRPAGEAILTVHMTDKRADYKGRRRLTIVTDKYLLFDEVVELDNGRFAARIPMERGLSALSTAHVLSVQLDRKPLKSVPMTGSAEAIRRIRKCKEDTLN